MATTMRRTQIYLPAELTNALDRLARQRGVSRAELIRQAAERLLVEAGATARGEDDPILGLIGLAHGEGGNVSEEHDTYLASHELARWSP